MRRSEWSYEGPDSRVAGRGRKGGEGDTDTAAMERETSTLVSLSRPSWTFSSLHFSPSTAVYLRDWHDELTAVRAHRKSHCKKGDARRLLPITVFLCILSDSVDGKSSFTR